jgi:hypothetical protein
MDQLYKWRGGSHTLMQIWAQCQEMASSESTTDVTQDKWVIWTTQGAFPALVHLEAAIEMKQSLLQ